MVDKETGEKRRGKREEKKIKERIKIRDSEREIERKEKRLYKPKDGHCFISGIIQTNVLGGSRVNNMQML